MDQASSSKLPEAENQLTIPWNRLRIGLTVWATLWGIVSVIVMAVGFSQAYTMDPNQAGLGAPPVPVMSGVVGIAVFLEVILTLTRASPKSLLGTVFYRYFVYGCIIVFGFLSMAFMAAVGEGLAAFGCIIWVFQAVSGVVFVNEVEKHQVKILSREQLRHCCGIGCCTKSGWGMCCRWTLWVFALLFFVQACCVLSDQLVYLQGGNGTNGTPISLVSATAVTGKVSNLAIYCDGIQNGSDPVILLEAGGGSGLGSMIPVLMNLTKTYPVRACAYDRAGYGFSQTSLPYPDVDNSPVMIYDVLTKIGERGPYVCAGHSAGGTECRSLKRLYPANVTGIVLMDAYCNVGECNIEQVWNDAMGLSRSAYGSTYNIRLAIVDASRYFAPFLFLRLGTVGGNSGLMLANIGGNMAWNAQYFGFRPPLNATKRDRTVEQMWWTPDILGNTPLVIATAGAMNKTCAEMGYVDNEYGKSCTNLILRQNATYWQVQRYLATSNMSIAFDCPDCNHGFVQAKAGLAAKYIMYAWEAAKTGSWPLWTI